MAAPGPWTTYDNSKLFAVNGTNLLAVANSFKIALVASGYTPNVATHSIFANITNELATANGYTAGGAVAAAPSLTLAAGTVAFDVSDVVWTGSGAGFAARYAVLYAVGTLNGNVNPLVAYMLLDSAPADVSVSAGNTLTITIVDVLRLT